MRGEAARRFWGPAGWWMRLTLAGTSGVGAAALLVRGSPLAAGGVAAGAALLGRLQRHTLERATERRMAEDAAPDEPTLRAAALALAGARTDALQRADDAGLPSTDALAAELVRLRAGVWEETAQLALPQAVARWWKVARFVLLPLVNGPLYALFGHVAYVVVRGYLEGHYAGADFLFNALALAGLIAASGAALASVTLLGVRRALVREGGRRFEAALGALTARLLAEARERNRPARDAARRLVAWAEVA